MGYFVSVKTAPEQLPVALGEVRQHAVIEFTEDDDLLERYVRAVVSRLDPPGGWLGRAMITQTLTYYLGKFPSGRTIKLPYPPLQTVSSLKYYNTDGTLTTVSAVTVYRVVAHQEPGFIELLEDQSWPTDIQDREFPIVVEYVAGYGDTPLTVPEDIRLFITHSVADHYAMRESFSVGVPITFHKYMENIINNYIFRFMGS